MQLDISHDPARLDRAMILHFLTTRAHWADGMDAALLERAIRHSLIIAAYHQGRQIGFARVITDYASFAYLSDVFVLPDWRGHGWARR
jgi:GNAT superfamily N-acetyltransferase